jgi:dihydrofolate synthase/folylpolyglutamate synthase
MRYNDAIHFIYNLELFGIKMGLGNITRMLEHLGNPQQSFRAIHIAGTNGKGSVAAMLFSVLKAAGYRVGVFTSPHLVDFRERFRTHRGVIGKQSLARFVGRHQKFIRDAHITFFEISTALAFWHFQRVGVEFAIAEVGLGGRLDATNVLKPELSVITNIDYDHTKILGSTLEKIAIEKAGIIKPGAPVVTGARQREVVALLRQIARERRTHLVRTPKTPANFDYKNRQMRFQLSANGARPFVSPLVGVHQMQNAAVVATCVEQLREQGVKIPERALRSGLRDTRWPGRFQVVCTRPLIVLDVAHNPAGARALIQSFRKAFPGRRAVVVFGTLERPDYDKMLQALAPLTRRAVITRPDYRRAAEIEGVIWAAVNAGIDFDVRLRASDAVDRALALTRPDEAILICGSHFTIGEAITRLQRLRTMGQLPGLLADITYMYE